MTVEDVLKRRFAAVLLQETPYVLEEARFGMFDIAAYVPEDSVIEGLGESRKLSAVRACNRYQLDGTCSEKKRAFLRSFEPVYDEQCLLQGFQDIEKGLMLSEKDFNMLIGSKEVVRHVIACRNEECAYLEERLKWESGFLAGYGLKQGLHLFEFKSDHDNVNRFWSSSRITPCSPTTCGSSWAASRKSPGGSRRTWASTRKTAKGSRS